jgi:hypothetical protein
MTLHLPNREKISTYRAKLSNRRAAVTTTAARNRGEIAVWIHHILEKLEQSLENSGQGGPAVRHLTSSGSSLGGSTSQNLEDI